MTQSRPFVGKPPVFSVCIPSYNSAGIIAETLDSLIGQTFTDFEVLVVDDCSTDATEAAVRRFSDPRIAFHRNARNLGYAGNVARCCSLATGRYIYLLGNDDVLSAVALERTHDAFSRDPEVALVTRPYYWFSSDDLETPVRFLPPIDPLRDRAVPVDCPDDEFLGVLDSLGQLSGLAFRRDVFAGQFDPFVFTAHVRPFLATWKRHKAAFLRDYVVAVRIASSQTRSIAGIYEPSPAWSWIAMFDDVFAEERYARQRALGRRLIAGHVEGLVQIRCYAGFGKFLREAAVLVRYRPPNLLWWKFWAYVLGLTLLPPSLARRLVDRFKPFVTDVRRQRIGLAQRGEAPPYSASSSAKIVACRPAAAANE